MGNTPAWCLEGPWLKSQHRGWLPCLTLCLCARTLKKILGQYLKIGHSRFLPHYFQSTINGRSVIQWHIILSSEEALLNTVEMVLYKWKENGTGMSAQIYSSCNILWFSVRRAQIKFCHLWHANNVGAFFLFLNLLQGLNLLSCRMVQERSQCRKCRRVISMKVTLYPGRGFETLWERDFPDPSRPSPRPTQFPVRWDRVYFPGGKMAGACGSPLTLSSVGVEYGYSYTSTSRLCLLAM